MATKTLCLPGFYNLLRKSRAHGEAKAAMKEAEQIDGLAALVARFIPKELFEPEEGTRDRKFTARLTFTAFLGQVMSRGSSCREAVRKVQSWYLASGQEPPGSNDSAYCQARGRLDLDLLRKVFQRLCDWFEGETKVTDFWCGRKVKLIDSTGLSMPDTDANRAEFEYAGNQRPGCGFPTGKLLGLFSLATGHLDHFIHGNWKEHDMGMIRSVIGWIAEKEIVVADRGFCGWGVMALLVRKNVDVVIRLHQRRDSSSQLTKWEKPLRRGDWGKVLWAELPDSLAGRRWQVELNLRDIDGLHGYLFGDQLGGFAAKNIKTECSGEI